MKRASSFVTLVLVMSAGAAVGSAETIPGAIDAELFAGDARLAYQLSRRVGIEAAVLPAAGRVTGARFPTNLRSASREPDPRHQTGGPAQDAEAPAEQRGAPFAAPARRGGRHVRL